MNLQSKILLLVLVCAALTGRSQMPALTAEKSLSNLRTKTIYITSDTVSVDSSTIFPGSLILRNSSTGDFISPGQYSFDMKTGKLIFLGTHPDSVIAVYRVFPVNMALTYQHKSQVLIKKGDTLYYDKLFYQPKPVDQVAFLDFGGLNYSGNFARGIQFGSNQDLTLNSNLDLRLSGKIANDIEIIAALSDNNIPLQPDGTTQQIQDFDKIFIQINKEPHHIIAGDYNLKAFPNYFLRFSKQLQGLNYGNDMYFRKKGLRLQTSTSFAVARGKFTRNLFNGQEGNQGPYRLTGANNETFIVILAGTEKVFVDGIRLTRGETNDYIIDYNTGEVTFMPRFLITKDSRIIVEFEYSDRNYFRSTLHNAVQVDYKKWGVYAQVYAEQDAKNRPILNDLDDSTKMFLGTIGNDLQNAFVSGVRETAYDPTRIQYRKTDTTVNAVTYDSVFVYSSDPDSAIYLLSFTYVGPNLGNYIPAKNSNNIRVYQWVEPFNGIPQGSYEPIILLVTPKSQQVATVGATYNDGKMRVRTEFAFSNFDRNTFSSIGNAQNKGYAAFGELNRNDSLKSKNYRFSTTVSYEFKQQNFQQVEPYRNQEFSRDWNISSAQNRTEHIARFQETFYDFRRKMNIGYRFTTFLRQGNYQGFEHFVPVNLDYKNIKLHGEIRQLNTKDSLNTSSFFRPVIDAKYAIQKAKGLYFGANAAQERNEIRNRFSDTLSNASFRFNIVGAQMGMPDTGKWTFLLDYKYRNDFNGFNNIFKEQSNAHLLDFKGSANKIKNQTFNWNFTFRNLKVLDTLLAKTQSEKTYLGRVEYGARIKKGAIRTNFIYELGGGQERVRQFTYVEVSAGQGFYKWIDENFNGIRELNEFVPAEFSDSAQYIRIVTDLNEYIRAYTTSYTQSLNFIPKAVWFAEKGIKKFVSKFQVQSYMQVKRKSLKADKVRPFNPFVFNSGDSNVISLNSNIRNSLMFNAGDPVYALTYTSQLLRDKILLVNGFDQRRRIDNILEGYYNLSSSFTLSMRWQQSRQLYTSQFFPANNFDLRVYVTEPKFTYNFRTMIRTSISYAILSKRNTPELGGEKTLSNKLEYDFRYSKAGKNTLEARFSFVLANYTGENGTTKSYTILEGLQPGKNYIWNMEYTRLIGSNLELTLVYEGRKTGSAKVVNTGRAQLRAIF